jgi:hypothetical protein
VWLSVRTQQQVALVRHLPGIAPVAFESIGAGVCAAVTRTRRDPPPPSDPA